MSISIPFSVTIEESVARMVGMDYIPSGFTLLGMTAAFQEVAEVEHYNAQINHLPADQIAALKIRMDACKARHSLAQLLIDALNHEIENLEGSTVKLSGDSYIQPRLTLESVSNWADEKYGICILEWLHASGSDDIGKSAENAHWEDVTIKIYKDYRIAYFSKQTGPKGVVKTFQNIGLMGTRKIEPNYLGGILIGLSLGEKFPIARKPVNKDAAAISKLRRALERLTNLSSDPFYQINDVDGWKLRFKIIDDRRNADERAKRRAVHVSIDEKKNHNTGDDYSGDSEEEAPVMDDFNNIDVDPADAATDAITNDWLRKNG